MGASITLTDPSGHYTTSEIAKIKADAIAAFAMWQSVLAPSSATISINIVITTDTLRSDGSSTVSQFKQHVGGFDIDDQGAAYELRNGIDPNGTDSDITIRLNPDFQSTYYWIDPLDGSTKPTDKNDLIDVLAHEMGHALAFNGWTDPSTYQLPGNYESPFDALITLIDGKPYFTGAHAEAVYGGPVPLTGGNVMHLGNNDPGPGSDLISDLMNGVVFHFDRYSISPLDVAILSDSGLATILSDNLLGSDSADTMNGGDGNDTVTSGAGNDTIRGGNDNDLLDGGAGADRMYGGAGNDTYMIDNISDRAYETTSGGIDDGGHDLVITSVTMTLGAFVEDLTISGSTATTSGNGNSLDNHMTGDANTNILRGLDGNDVLDGGSAGSDKLYGGAGNDTYVLHATVRVYEDSTAGIDDGGTDLVIADISYTLTNFVENLTLMGSAVSGYGNASNNLLRGDAVGNKLDGYAGADTMYGGAGNDSYGVDNTGDIVSEQTVPGVDDGGTDKVVSTVTYTLPASVEYLDLAGTAAVNGTGNNLANTINGNAGNNRLAGMAGNDKLTGGDGADDFVFSHYGAANGTDHLTDFVSGLDRLAFTASDFGFSPGHVLTSAELSLTGTAVGTTGQFVYDPVSHQLFWDSNGSNTGGATSLAFFDNAATPHTGDFVFS